MIKWKKDYLYNKLPRVYREYDINKELYLYLSALETGFDFLAKETFKILDLIDVDKCPDEYIPYLCYTLGIEYAPDIPIIYQRRFLKNAMMLNRRKGTKSAIEYLVRELVGYSAEVQRRVYMGKERYVVVIEMPIDEDIETSVSLDIVNRYIKYYMPIGLYIPVVTTSNIITKFPPIKHHLRFKYEVNMGSNINQIKNNIDIIGYRKLNHKLEEVKHNIDINTLIVGDTTINQPKHYFNLNSKSIFNNKISINNKVFLTIRKLIESQGVKTHKVFIMPKVDFSTKPLTLNSDAKKLNIYKIHRLDGSLTLGNNNVYLNNGLRLEEKISI